MACNYLSSREHEIRLGLYDITNTNNIYSSQNVVDLTDQWYESYLYTTVALLLNFMQDDDVALSILKEGEKHTWNSYVYYKLLSNLRWNQGQVTGIIIEPLEIWYQEVIRRKQKIRDHCSVMTCNQTEKDKLKEFMLREEAAELTIMNNYAYYVAEDLARGVGEATLFEATMSNFTNRLKKILDDKDPALTEGGVDRTDDVVDTYAFVQTVIESRRPVPDAVAAKRMSRDLKHLVEQNEETVRKSRDNINVRYNIALLKLARSHYAAAVQLAGEE